MVLGVSGEWDSWLQPRIEPDLKRIFRGRLSYGVYTKVIITSEPQGNSSSFAYFYCNIVNTSVAHHGATIYLSLGELEIYL